MTEQWVLRLPAGQMKSLGSLRLEQDIQASSVEHEIWLRGTKLDENLTRKLRSIPDSKLFHLEQDQQLIPAGKQVPLGYLPKTDWQPVDKWFAVQLGTPAFAGTLDERVPFQLIRSRQNQPANILLTTLVNLKSLVDFSPQIRLNPLRYAIDNQQRAILCGAPLPPLEGSFYYEQKGIAAAAGWTWSPAVDVEVLQSLFQLKRGDVVLLHADQTRELIRSDRFAPLTRSSVRLTLQQFEREGKTGSA
ncbi:hypothetical protein [Gimesia panareensis]|uniref:hypothetical protein n=1 Tax=Gimesia panareensis TaxID=2527978 RepID=UPI00118C7384|nr:hypothetical protein [Gimesia panareensis]QDU49251.1 hypothetical protein Pan110_15700 [Gimesia panareensis]